MQAPETSPLEEILDDVTSCSVGMPVLSMAEVLEHGEAAVGPVARALDRWSEDDERDVLWLLVLLGELGSPAAIPALAPLLAEEGLPTERSVAAAEALAKIGAAAVPALREATSSPRRTERILAYGALGAIPDPAAHDALIAALATEREAPDVVVAALAERGTPADAPAVLSTYRRVPAHLRPQIEEGLRELHSEKRSPGLLDRDWRLRYRRQPRLGTFEPGWPGVAAILHADPENWADIPETPLRTLEEVLASEPEGSGSRCECCDLPYEEPTCVSVCPKTATRAAAAQLALIEQEAEQGFDDLHDLLDDLEGRMWALCEKRMQGEGDDEADAGHGCGDEACTLEHGARNGHAHAAAEGDGEDRIAADLSDGEDPEDDDEEDDEGDEISAEEEEFELLRMTTEWLLEQGVDNVEAGAALLRSRTVELQRKFGIDGRAEVVAKPGRNEACPCGSGRKYKRCCGAT